MIVSGNQDGSINWEPGSELTEVVQNVQTLLSTHVFSVPLDRRLGVLWDAIDEPLNGSSESILREELLNVIQTYEPRAIVNSVEFTYDPQKERMIPVVDISIKGGETA
ncbi:MAG: GPW/gp25 family protein [Clostridiales bacterium]|nr:GPW/gp25 family protein [Clostridiales bacterium]MDY2870843.1 hypothetical protein [Succiniclasticum sp.]